METFRAAAFTACFLGLVFSLLENMIPSEKFSKQIKLIFSLILVISVVEPFMGADFNLSDISYDTAAPQDFSEMYNERLDGKINSNICRSVEELLVNEQIYPIKITVDINNSADGSISITNAEVVLPDSADAAKTKRIVSQALGIEVTVTVAEKGTE